MGEQPHAHLQGIIYAIFRETRRAWGIGRLPEQRVQVAERRYRIPDICVIRNTDPKDTIIGFAPLLCVEILSKDDTLSELQHRVKDYAARAAKEADHIAYSNERKHIDYERCEHPPHF